MKKLIIFLILAMFFVISCSSSKKAENDADIDILPDEDAVDEETIMMTMTTLMEPMTMKLKSKSMKENHVLSLQIPPENTYIPVTGNAVAARTAISGPIPVAKR